MKNYIIFSSFTFQASIYLIKHVSEEVIYHTFIDNPVKKKELFVYIIRKSLKILKG